MLAIKNVKRKKQLTMKKTSIIKGIYALPIIVLLGCLFHVISLTDKLQEQIEQRDKTIQDLAFSDSLVHKYFLIKKDSIKNVLITAIMRWMPLSLHAQIVTS